MVIERRLSFAQSRQQGVGFVNTLLGKRAWEKVLVGSAEADRGTGWRILDDDTLEFGETVIPASSRMYGTTRVTRLTRGAINENCSGFRWRPNDGLSAEVAGEVKVYEDRF